MSSDEEHQFEFEDDMELNGEDDSEMEYDDEDELDSDAEEELEEDLQAFSRSKVQEQREFIFDKIALEQKLEEIQVKWPTGELPWPETLQVTYGNPITVQEVHDDLKRETAFYEATMANVNLALQRLDQYGIKHQRPADYYAETLKTDDQMLKIKDHLLASKRRIDEKQDRIKQKNMKKFAKQVQVQTKLKREQNKKEDLNAIKNWRKMQKNVDTRQEEFPEALLQEGSKVRRDIAEKVNNRSGPSKKRKAKDQKYGYGGVKRGKKGNTADSAMDTSQWSAKQNKRLSPGLAKGLKASSKQRPGKAARQNSRGKK